MGRATNSAIQVNANKHKPSPYIGDVMFNCFIRPSDFKHACAVIVSGDSINYCGHALLHIGGVAGTSMWQALTKFRDSCTKLDTNAT